MTRLLAVVGLALLGGGVTQTQDVTSVAKSMPSVAESEVTECLDCQKCSNESLHQVFEDVDLGNSYGSSGHSHCSAIGDCFSGHADHTWLGENGCGPLRLTDAELGRLRVALARANEGELRSLRHKHRGALRLNVARNAVQLTGCNGMVVAQFVIAGDVIRSLADDE